MLYLNIPANYNFLENLYFFILEKFKENPILLSEITILLPSRRSCNELKRIFLNSGTAILLPKIKAIGDIDYDDLDLETIELGLLKKFDEISKPISNIKYKILMIKKLASELKNDNIEYLINLRGELDSFLNEIEKENLELDNLGNIVPEDYAIYWQKILKILKSFGNSWNKYLTENNIISNLIYRLKIINLYSEIFTNKQPKNPIIIAGNICSTKSTMNLVKILSKYNNTFFIFKGYENILENKEFYELEPTHSHYFYKKITENLNIKKVENIGYQNCMINNQNIANGIYKAMLPADLTYRWQDKKENYSLDNIELIECSDSFEELDAINFILLDFLHKNGLKNIAIITDVDFGRQIESSLKFFNIPYNNTFGNKLIYTKLIQFLNSLIDVYLENMDPINLLTILKNNYTYFDYKKEDLNELIELFEENILRGKNNLNGFKSYKNIINSLEDSNLKNRLNSFIEKIENYFDINFSNVKLSECIKNHLQLAEKISNKDLWFLNKENEKIFELLQDFIVNSDDFIIKNIKDYSAIFKNIISELSFNNEYSKYPAVNIISITEARLINYDLIIFTNLNEGTFPKNIPTDPWMNKSMRKKFGLPDKEIELGIENFEFIQILMQKKVILTRTLKENNKPTIKSRFLSRLETYLKCNDCYLKQNYDILKAIKEFNKQKNLIKIERPNPCPPVNLRPKKLSATNIERLIKNPYEIYCKYVLDLYKKDDINLQNNILIFGNVVHKIFEEYSLNYNQIKIDKLTYLENIGKKIFNNYFYDDNASIILFFDRFLEIAKKFIEIDEEIRKNGYEIFTELTGKCKINNFTITAKADRIEKKCNNLKIVDYKTGKVPSKNEVVTGISLQLLIEALIAKNNGFFENTDVDNIESVKYWALKCNNGRDLEINNVELKELVEKTEKFLNYVIEYFNNIKNPYQATGKNKDKNNYLHLSRLEEWIYY